MRTITESIENKSSGTSNRNYSPSVPLSVYRDLVGELQATQAKLDTLNTKNQELVQENHLLRQEIATVVKSISHLQKWTNISDDNGINTAPPVENYVGTSKSPSQVSPLPETDTTESESRELPAPPTTTQSHDQNSFFTIPGIEMPTSPEPVYLEEQEVSYYPTNEEKIFPRGWWLMFCILVIIFTAFGTGYLIVRPLFQNNSR